MLGGLVFAAGAMWIATVPTAEPAYLTAWLPGSILTGVGVGLVLPSLSAAAVAKLPPARFGIGSAINQAVRQIGSVLGVALAIVIVGRAPTLARFDLVFHWQAGLALLTALLAWPVDTRPRPTAL